MTVRKPWEPRHRSNGKPAEIHVGQTKLAQLMREQKKAQNRSEQTPPKPKLGETTTDEEVIAYMQEHKPKKYAGMLRQLDIQKSLAAEIADPLTRYDGDVRVTTVTDRPGMRHRLVEVIGLSSQEADLIFAFPDQFPGLVIRYHFWMNKSFLVTEDVDAST